MKAALLVLFAYAGFENTSAPAGEFKNPKRDIPFALIVQIVIVTAIYTLVQLVAIGTIPNLGVSQTPLADAGRMLMGPLGGFLLTIGAVLSVLGTNNNTVLAGPRYLYALAEGGRLPRVLREDPPEVPHAVRRDPHPDGRGARPRPDRHGRGARRPVGDRAPRDLHRHGLAVPVLRRKLPATERTIRLPGGPTIPILALVICLLFLSAAQAKNWIAGGIALAAGAAIYFSRGAAAARADRLE